jgi:hypothetical protein
MIPNWQSFMFQRKDTLQRSKCVLINGLSCSTTVSSVTIRMETFTSPARECDRHLVGITANDHRLHKRNFRLDNGDCTNDDQFKVLAFDVKEENEEILLLLPPPDDLDAMIGSSKCKIISL